MADKEGPPGQRHPDGQRKSAAVQTSQSTIPDVPRRQWRTSCHDASCPDCRGRPDLALCRRPTQYGRRVAALYWYAVYQERRAA